MDRALVSEARDPGSIPGGDTQKKPANLLAFLLPAIRSTYLPRVSSHSCRAAFTIMRVSGSGTSEGLA